jgi:hypothetical protein
MKYAKIAGVVRWSGGSMVLNAGRTTADDDHPLVLERPDLWTDEVPTPTLPGPKRAAEQRGEAPIETATRAPGEKRPGARRG